MRFPYKPDIDMYLWCFVSLLYVDKLRVCLFCLISNLFGVRTLIWTNLLLPNGQFVVRCMRLWMHLKKAASNLSIWISFYFLWACKITWISLHKEKFSLCTFYYFDICFKQRNSVLDLYCAFDSTCVRMYVRLFEYNF